MAIDSPYSQGHPSLLGWLKEGVQEGERINQADPNFHKMDRLLDYVLGEQLPFPRPTYLPGMTLNRSKKAIRAHVSALTDVKPLLAYKTTNPRWDEQKDLLNTVVMVWWVNGFIDLDLADAVRYSLALGSADVIVEWNPHSAGGLGDTQLSVRDPRDTLPFRPTRSRTIQDWQGVTVREAHSPNALAAQYPQFIHLFKSKGGFLGQIFSKFRRSVSLTSPVETGDILKARPVNEGVPEIVLYRTFLKDTRRNLTGQPVLMGDAGTNWAYEVPPNAPLYPRGRLVIWTDGGVISDSPNPYWHGMFPISRLKLDPWPWSFYGSPLLGDLMPMQDAINKMGNDFLSVFSQWVNRTTVADKNSVPESVLRRFDPRKPLNKLKLNPTYGEGFKLLDGPTLPPWAMQFFETTLAQFDDLAGFANLQALMQLRQLPGADTIQRYSEGLTPELRVEGRLMEAFLRELGTMVKDNIFQFYGTARRLSLLGDAGITLEDLDYDPGTMIPALNPGDQGYLPELDGRLPRHTRASIFKGYFSFYVQPNSMLAMNAQEQKMLYLQLSRQGYLDFWTLMEKLEIPNVGSPPPVPLPDFNAQPPIDPQTGQPAVDPTTGAPPPPPVTVRVPVTITERLLAQAALGLGMTDTSAGRKASGQKSPDLKEKSNGDGTSRQVMSESG